MKDGDQEKGQEDKEKQKQTRETFDVKYKRFQIYDPSIKRMAFKTFSPAKYTTEQIEQLGKEWLDGMRKKIADARDADRQHNIPDKPFTLPRDETSGQVILMIGSTRAGKTTLLDYILEHHFDKHIKVLFSDSLQSKAYDQIKKNCDMVSPIFVPQILRDEYKINKETKNKFEFLNVLDDVVDEKHDKELMRACTIYRNSRISTLINIQTPTLVKATSRGNCHYVLLGRCNSDELIENVVKKYLSSYFPSELKMVDKMKLYRELVEDYHFLMIDNINETVCRVKIDI